MASSKKTALAHARTDGEDRLIEADELLAGLQVRCGGELPGTVAIPELLALVRKSRQYGLRLARLVGALDGDERVEAWVEIAPYSQNGQTGCDIAVASWQASPLPPESDQVAARRRLEIDRATAELSARLDPGQRLLTVEADAADLREAATAMRAGIGKPWTQFVELVQNNHRQPMHWRLLDGARCTVTGSQREWTVSLVPLGRPMAGSAGFELYLVADRPLIRVKAAQVAPSPLVDRRIGRELSPVLRKPIARIIANAETIRSRLAGPLGDEYSQYAADIASAGQHLLSLLDDLADLEVVESEGFSTAPDRIDLMDIVKRATGILGVRARERQITLEIEGGTAPVLAIGEFRRALQVLLNLIGNAIHYSPKGSTVSISLSSAGSESFATVADSGPGLSREQQDAVFRKFERLGRSGDGGSGLGLYISRKLALAMGGDLTVSSKEGEGARFTLALPALEDRRTKPR
ncbi:HAMP domain-containing sensor histidine kinase [Altererythrobacter sp. H2]|uniref:sensor histidine kinase n=1 Tax=Altererythrobacter sp. H2 TaxID=3108391 RepID=UPI002B4BDE06|nr:HAMP domain-containing sensor histidine kinase [Altererythrobacter sp. H2]WRK94374.1 HAMP domain-containing sensor histidine kinase [Altererythrobacter sp. H2]